MTMEISQQLNFLVLSLSDLVKSQATVEQKLITMIKDVDDRNIQRNEASEKRLEERLRIFIHEMKLEVKDPLKKLISQQQNIDYYETKKKGFINLLISFMFLSIAGTTGAFIHLLISTSNNETSISQNTNQIKTILDQINDLEQTIYIKSK